jgi:exopolyphosphatase / guanosine-5'-triphosphate,3'-diphosphate pyrophosphatase
LPPDKTDLAIKLGTIFRLSACLNRSRSTRPLPHFVLNAKKTALTIAFPSDWLAENPLTQADLEEDAQRLKGVGIELTVVTN